MFISHFNRLIKEKKITTQKLADLSGVSRQALFKARQDDGISECRLSTLTRIADALGVDVKETFERKPSESHEQKC